jgi:pyruvate dehydrogenase E2 component (dihydrolipoamide acetyltransferase)
MATMVTMPRLSPTMEEGVLAKWTKKEGDKISPGDVIAEVETDKANMDFPLEDEGVLLKLLVKEGQTVKLGEPVAVLGEAGEDISSLVAAPAVAPAPAAPQKQPSTSTSTTTTTTTTTVGNGRVKASPLAKKIAAEKGVDVAALAGSGPGGRVIKRDVVEAKPSAPAVQQVFARGEDVTVAPSMMRKTIAKRLVEAKREIPHIYLTADATCDRLMVMREEMNAAAPEGTGTKISVNDLVVKAMALALRNVPDANVSWTDAGIVRYGRVDVGVAVSIPDGLITPVVRNADQKSIGALSAEVKSLAGRARDKKLKPEEFSGGTASVTNLGMFGIREFCAIINPPEAVILAVGKTEKRPAVVDDKVVVQSKMTLTLSCDHRVVDGVLGAKLLAEVVRLLEHPMALVL